MNAMASMSPSQTAAASSKETLAGLCVVGQDSGRHTYSACAPKWRRDTPKTASPKTASPGANAQTLVPTASTSPASSLPRMIARGRRRPLNGLATSGSPRRKPQSVRFTVVARTRISTSSYAGTGLGRSSRRRTSSGGPYLVCTLAFMGRPSASSRGQPHSLLPRHWRTFSRLPGYRSVHQPEPQESAWMQPGANAHVLTVRSRSAVMLR